MKYSNYFYKNSIAFFLVMFLVADGYSQNLHTIDIVESQPLIYRDKDGNYIGCGIRVVFATNTPTPLSFGDISVNLYISSSKPIGLAKALFSDSQDGSVWSCPYKTGHSAFATSRINSLGDFSLNPLWG